MAWLDGWNKRIKITSDNTKVDASVKGLALDLSNITADDFWNNVKSDGADIRITKDDGESLLARDVISIDTTEETGLIRFDTGDISTSSDEDYYLYFDNENADEPSASDTYGQYNAYDSNLIAYYPLDETSGTTASDRTENENDGTANNARVFTSEVAGIINTGADFTQGSDIIDFGLESFGNSLDLYSVSLWLKSGTKSSNEHFLSVLNDGATLAIQYFITSSNNLDIYHRDEDGKRVRADLDISSYLDNTWFNLIIVTDWSSNSIKVYINNEEKTVNYVHQELPTSTTTFDYPVIIGARQNRATLDSFFDGEIDEVGIRDGALSSDEVETVYNNESDNSSFWTIGDVEDDSLDYVIKGKVKRGTQNIENVKVYLMNQDTGEIEQTTTTDVNGDYIFEDLSSEVLYSVGCLEYREENGETIRYNERTFYDIEP